MTTKKINNVCVYCASSNKSNEVYVNASKELGKILAINDISITYGGGSRGLMGHVANSAITHGGKVKGIMPEFMVEQEWAHNNLGELIIVQTMHERKALMIEKSDAVIALPGGSGTLEELFEVITLKRLGMYLSPIILINTLGFYDSLIALFERMVEDNFLDPRHKQLVAVVDEPGLVLKAIQEAEQWEKDAIYFAAL